MEKPYISFCIPTYNRLDILIKTIESIYLNVKEDDFADFEVVVSDNEPNNSAKIILDKFNYSNLHYYSTTEKGFLNSINALKCGKGIFLKLINNYSRFKTTSTSYLINEVISYKELKPILFYTDGLNLKGIKSEFIYFEEFINELSYLSSWSSGFGIWKSDFDVLEHKIKINEYFPHSSFLFALSNKCLYVIDDKPLFDNQKVNQKGGYNIFKVFAVDFVNMLVQLQKEKVISNGTFLKIKKDILFKYLSARYYKTVIAKIDNFEKSDIKASISVHYNLFCYYKMQLLALVSPIKYLIRLYIVKKF